VKNLWLSIGLTVIVSLAAGWFGSELGVQRTLRSFPGPVSGAIRFAVKRTLSSDLHLSADQTRAIAALNARYEPRRQALAAEMVAAREDLARALVGQTDYGPEARAVALRRDTANEQLQELLSLYLMEVRRVLTPAQRSVLDRNLSKILRTGSL
jgi:hypothetical protein